jgi:hypothetical protein
MKFDEKGRFVPSTKTVIIPKREQVPAAEVLTKEDAELVESHLKAGTKYYKAVYDGLQ